jgi:dihydroneopterin aldolase
MTDCIRLNEMVFYGHHGVLPEEQALGQRFVVDVELVTDLRKAGATDNLDETVNYSAVYAAVRDIVTGPPLHLIEAVAERIAARILADHAAVERVSVRVRKPAVPIAGAVLGSAEVGIERDRTGGT